MAHDGVAALSANPGPRRTGPEARPLETGGPAVTVVTPIQREEPLEWTTYGGDVVPVGSRGQLGGLIENWNAYGSSAQVGSQTAPDRQARVVSLGADGWLVHLRDASMQKDGWPRSKIVCAFGEDGKPSTRPGDDADYWPRLESDLLLYPRLQRDVLDTPMLAASVTWAWLFSEPLPDGYGVFRTDFEPIECTSMQEAFERIPGDASPR